MGRDRREDEGQYYPGGKTIPVTPQRGGGSVVLDDTVTQNSQNGVKSSGIWSWVKSLLPAWLTPGYAEPATVASVNAKYTKPIGGIPLSDIAAEKFPPSTHTHGLSDINGLSTALAAWLSAFKGSDTTTTLASVLAAINDKLSKSGELAVMTGFIQELRAYKIIFDDNYCAALISMSQSWMKLSVKQGGTFHFEIRDDNGYEVAMSKLTPDGSDVATMLRVIADNTAEYSTSAAYAVGAFVRHEGAIYVCHTATTAGEAWDSTKWTAMPNVADYFSASNTLLTARINALVDDKIGDINDALDAINGEVA